MDNEIISFLNEQASHLEKKRQMGIRLNYLYRIVRPLRAILQVVLFILIVINTIVPFILPVTIGIGIFFLILSIFNDPKEVYESKLKYDILPEIFKHINDSYRYSYQGHNKTSLKESGFLDRGFLANSIKIVGEDYISGKIENTVVEFFGVKFLKEQVNYGKTAGGCLLSIILLPIDFIRSILEDRSEFQDQFFEFDIERDLNAYLTGFFMFADFSKPHSGRTFMIPKKYMLETHF